MHTHIFAHKNKNKTLSCETASVWELQLILPACLPVAHFLCVNVILTSISSEGFVLAILCVAISVVKESC